jgi:hypothetical protein
MALFSSVDLSCVALALSVLGAAVAIPSWVEAKEPTALVRTGEGVRTKSVAFLNVKVYSIAHEMRELPPTKSKRAIIDSDVDKRFNVSMMRDVDAEKIRNALKDAYAINGYSDSAKIGVFLSVLDRDLKEKSGFTITYDAETKRTVLSVHGGRAAAVEGVDFMKATWSIWFGKIDQPELSDALMRNMR